MEIQAPINKKQSELRNVTWPITPSHLFPIKAMMSSTDNIVFFFVHIWNIKNIDQYVENPIWIWSKLWRLIKLLTSTRQSCWTSKLIQRVPGMDFVLTTLYLPLGFHTSMETGLAISENLKLENELVVVDEWNECELHHPDAFWTCWLDWFAVGGLPCCVVESLLILSCDVDFLYQPMDDVSEWRCIWLWWNDEVVDYFEFWKVWTSHLHVGKWGYSFYHWMPRILFFIHCFDLTKIPFILTE